MSLYPILWAVEHAPVADATERAVLAALVMKGSFDGRDCHRSYSSLGKIARTDRKTAERKCHEMERRGILRRQDGPMPQSWLNLSADKKTVVWEVMIPASFWSAVQLEEINQTREERGLPPVTPESRPEIAPPPPKKTRSDKGKPRKPRKDSEDSAAPKSSPKKRGDSQSRRSTESDGTDNPVAGGLTIPSRGDSQSPNPPKNPPLKTSSSFTSVTQLPDVRRAEERQEEEGFPDKDGTDSVEDAAARLVATAAESWKAHGHRAPSKAEALRLARRVVEELGQGATPEAVSYTLTRDLRRDQVRTTAVQVIMRRTGQPGWAEEPPATAPVVRQQPWCGACDETSRFVDDVDAQGRAVSRPCPQCSNQAAARAAS